MKRINIISNYSSVYAGNFISSLYYLYLGLIEENNFVILSFPKAASSRAWLHFLKDRNIRVEFFDNESTFKTIRTIKNINKKYKTNVVYSHFISVPIVKLLCPLKKNTKLIIHIHSDFRGGRKASSMISIIKKMFFYHIIRKDAKYIYVSDYLKKEDKLKNSYYVQNALCLNRIYTSDVDLKYLEKKSNNKKVILSFGWSPYIKGIDIVCKSYLALSRELRNNTFLFIVVNDNGKDSCINFVKKSIGVDITSVPDILLINPQEDVFSLFKISDIFVSSSRSEGFSYSVLEALYFGLRVIVSNIDGTQWSREYGSMSFDLENYIELSDLMESCLTGDNKKEINNSIAETFSLESWVNKIKSILI